MARPMPVDAPVTTTAPLALPAMTARHYRRRPALRPARLPRCDCLSARGRGGAAELRQGGSGDRRAGGTDGISVRLLHTGQHYDRALSGGFIERLGMREPDANLGVGSGTHAEQTAGGRSIGIEADLLEHPADLVAGRRATSTRRWPRRSPRPSCTSRSPTSSRVSARATGRCPRR